MNDEQVLALVEHRHSDYDEGVGEFGGYVRYHVENGILRVKVETCTSWEGDDDLEVTVKHWKLVPLPPGGA